MTWTVERGSAWVTIAGFAVVLLTGAMAYGGLTEKVYNLEKAVEKIEDGHKDGLCQQLVMRQVTAIEKNAAAVITKLGAMAETYNCIEHYDDTAYATATVDAGPFDPTVDTAAATEIDEEWLERRRFESDLSEIDEALGINMWKQIRDSSTGK